jgi:hypothetical protein
MGIRIVGIANLRSAGTKIQEVGDQNCRIPAMIAEFRDGSAEAKKIKP